MDIKKLNNFVKDLDEDRSYNYVFETKHTSDLDLLAGGIIFARTDKEALHIAEHFVSDIKKRMKKRRKNENTSDKVVDHSNVDDLDSGT